MNPKNPIETRRPVWDRFVRVFHWTLVGCVLLNRSVVDGDADLHALLVDGLIVLVGLHVTAAIAMGRLERTRLIKAMVTGVKERW